MAQLSLEEEYRKSFAGSGKIYQEAVKVIPGGITHDIRSMQPFPPYIERASGAYKWDVDGHRLIDCRSGHGALVLGHCHPQLVEAMVEQAQKGTHYSASHELEVEWAKLVVELSPCAEMVRFVASGTEASLMAMRLARAFTGKSRIVKFFGHFHGWHDYGLIGQTPPFDVPASAGIPNEVGQTVTAVPSNDIQAVVQELEKGDVAAVIVEPAGANTGIVPLPAGFQQELREVTRQMDTLLIFDEVVTGFRFAPGGAQEFYGVTPDMATYAKALTGGVPGGAVGGRTDIMELLAFRDDPTWNRYSKFKHYGTFNANPLSAASGVAALKILKTGAPQKRVNHLAALLREGLNQVLKEAEIPGCAYGEGSSTHMYFDREFAGEPGDPQAAKGHIAAERLLKAPPAASGLRQGMMLNGSDMRWRANYLSAAHTEEDIQETVEAFRKTLGRLLDEGALKDLLR